MTTTITTTTLLSQLQWRYAVKKFDPTKKIGPEDWKALEESLVLAPSSFGLQPWKFIVIQDPTLKAQLPAISWGQTQPAEASHFVVLAQRKNLSHADVEHYVQKIAEVRGASLESLAAYRGVMDGFLDKAANEGWLDIWSSRQVYIALGTLLTSAALLGIDACPMEGINVPAYDELLGLPAQGYTALCATALGYRAADDPYATLAKVRFPVSEIIEHR